MKSTNKNKHLRVWLSLLLLMVTIGMAAQNNRSWRNKLREESPEFFKTEEARRIGEQVMLFQRVTGGWPKNIDMVTPLNDSQREQVMKDKEREDDSTTDNGATTMQMVYLARLYQATKDKAVRGAFAKAVEFLLSGQYENGGWPQFWPHPRGYQVHITFNDDAMANTMNLLREIAEARSPYQGGLADKSLRRRAQQAFDKGVECILNTQIIVDGEPTIWCQQHYRDTFLPAPARAFELASFGTQESATLTQLLMSLPRPDERVKKAVHGAMRWFDTYKLTGLRVVRTGFGTPDYNTRLVEEAGAGPIWARYYDFDRCEPFVCDRDGIPRQRLEDIGPERRNGYAWYGDRPATLYPLYEKWVAKYDPEHRVDVSLATKGANENGRLKMYTKRTVDASLFDAVVSPGDRIQDYIDRAPKNGQQPYKILIRKGTYQQKVIVCRPHIVLVGEDRDSTVLQLAEVHDNLAVSEYEGQPVGNGVVVLQEGADDCLISGLTIYNNYGTTVEKTTRHQMAVFGRATRTIIVNCNIWADGNDALSLWAKEGNGMYYHADLSLRCPGVDFLCPRGWCYATRCRFHGDGRAIVWHDGRGDKRKKLVITNSYFDAASPTILGRYHHDAQFYFVTCRMSANILDTNISYAYTDKVLDPCPWGLRTYYYNCTREGGHGPWMNDNLDKAEGTPEFHAITALWTFDGKWDPEKTVRELWPVIGY